MEGLSAFFGRRMVRLGRSLVGGDTCRVGCDARRLLLCDAEQLSPRLCGLGHLL